MKASPGVNVVPIKIVRPLVPLLAPARYKAAWGGRAGAKSHFFAEQIVIQGRAQALRIACIREVQNSLKESVRQVIIDKILGLKDVDGNPVCEPGEWTILDSEIRHNRTGTLIIFKGMQSYNADNIKSLEGFDIVWVEEAQTLSKRSLRILRPTVRKEGSQLWFSWNPRHEEDAVDDFFRSGEPPPNSIIVETSWRDNPFLSPEVLAEIEHDYRTDPEMAHHVWGGGYEEVTEGAYYAKYVAQAEKDGRIGHFPYDPRLRLRTAWDIGVDDYTAIWFVQDDGHHATVIDYYETSGDGPDAIVPTALPELIPDAELRALQLAEFGRETPFAYDRHFLPHDVMVREWGAGAKERYRTLKEFGVWPIGVGTATGPVERINAVRKLFPRLRFHNTRRVQKGLSRLRRYSRKYNEKLGIWEGPHKDGNDHGADALGEYAIQCGLIVPVEKPAPRPSGELTYEAVTQPDGRTVVQSNMSIMDIVNKRLKQKQRRRRS